MKNEKDVFYSAIKNLTGVEHSITQKNNNIKGVKEMEDKNIINPKSVGHNLQSNGQKDPVMSELIAQAKTLEDNKSKQSAVDAHINNNESKEMENMFGERVNGHVVVLGVGAAGGNTAHLAKEEQFATMAINTAMDDTTNIDVDHIFIIKDAFGSGKERQRAKEKFVADSPRFLQEFNTNFPTQKTVIVAHSAGGGTGAGIGPMLAKVIKKKFPDRNVFLFVSLANIQEDIKAQQNIAETLEDISKAGVNYLIFDNGKVDGSVDKVYQTVNGEMVSAMKVISRQYFVANNRRNIDLTDMQKLYLDNKRMIIVSGKFDRKVSGAGDYQQQILDAVTKSTQIGTYDSKIEAYGFFLNVEESMYENFDINFRKVQEVLGEGVESFAQLQNRVSPDGPDFSIILAGLDEIADRYALVNKRIAEFNERRAANKSISQVEKVVIAGRGSNSVVVPGEASPVKDNISIDASDFSEFM